MPKPLASGAYSGLGPSNPPNRRPYTATARTVDKIRTRPERLFQTDFHRSLWARFRYQPRPNMSRFRPNSGHVSTCNAGAHVASPAAVLPSSPSKPGTIHHQDSGASPLSTAMKGVSTLNNLSI